MGDEEAGRASWRQNRLPPHGPFRGDRSPNEGCTPKPGIVRVGTLSFRKLPSVVLMPLWTHS